MTTRITPIATTMDPELKARHRAAVGAGWHSMTRRDARMLETLRMLQARLRAPSVSTKGGASGRGKKKGARKNG